MYYIVTFQNTYDVMNAEKKVKELGFEYNIMPIPASITMSCGMCIRIEKDEYINQIKNNDIFKYKVIYIKDTKGFEMLD